MPRPTIEPHKTTRPMHVIGACLVGMVMTSSAFLVAAAKLQRPEWASAFLAVSAVAVIPIFLSLIFVLLTKYRSYLQDDKFYAAWIKRQRRIFTSFEPENKTTGLVVQAGAALVDEGESLERQRIARYEQYRGVFLVHSWRPSQDPAQVADIVIELRQHGDGPLTEGRVECVDYALGPKFFGQPVRKHDRSNNFRIEVSAYGPMLCLARVHLSDSTSVILERYVDFEV